MSFRATPEIQAAVNAAFAPLMPAKCADAARVRRARAVSRRLRDAAGAGRAAGARAVQRLRHGHQAPIERIAPGRGRARSCDWLVSESGWTVTERDEPDRARADRAAPRVPAVPPLQQLWPRRHAALRARARGAPVPHVLVGADRFTSARKSRRCATPSARSNGPTTNLRSLRRCAARCSRSPTTRCCAFATRRRHSLNPLQPLPDELAAAQLKEIADALGACCAGCTAAAIGDRSPTRSRACSPRRARTRASRSGRPASRRWPT